MWWVAAAGAAMLMAAVASAQPVALSERPRMALTTALTEALEALSPTTRQYVHDVCWQRRLTKLRDPAGFWDSPQEMFDELCAGLEATGANTTDLASSAPEIT